MSVFLTPDGRPFYGGTYFPDQPRHGMPSFRQLLARIGEVWRDDRAEIEASATRLAEHVRDGQASPDASSSRRSSAGPRATRRPISTRRRQPSSRRSMPATAAGAARPSSRSR